MTHFIRFVWPRFRYCGNSEFLLKILVEDLLVLIPPDFLSILLCFVLNVRCQNIGFDVLNLARKSADSWTV